MGECLGGYGVMGVYGGIEPTWAAQTNVGRTHIATKGIVQSGLVLNLDAGVSSSYSGSGTTWFDLSTTSRNASLVNGVGYNSGNGGSLVFDGVDDNVNLSSGFSITNNFSVELWCLPEVTHQIDSQATSGTTGTSGKKYIIGATFVGSPDAGFGISIGTNGVSTYEHSSSYMPCLLSHEETITSFTQVTVVYTNKQPSLYLNGNFIKNGLTSPRTNVRLVGNTIGYGTYGRHQGNLSSVRYYDRILTPQEIQQNFIATRSRFGI
jgi:hypothetical protein